MKFCFLVATDIVYKYAEYAVPFMTLLTEFSCTDNININNHNFIFVILLRTLKF
jgi:hypothetical protein